MALSGLTVWEVRTTGVDTNGGGFVTGASGTDYSQQAAAQYALTNGVTQGTTVILTASAATDMVGNIAYVAGGTGAVVGAWYQITAATAGVSITVDRSTGLTAGTGATINVGGALLSPGILASLLTVTGMLGFIKAGTFSITSASTNVAAGCISLAASQVKIVGYDTTRSIGNTDTKPILQLNVSTATLYAGALNSNYLNNLALDGNNQTSSKLIAGGNLVGCSISNFNVASTGTNAFLYCTATGNNAIIFNLNAFGCEGYANSLGPFGGTAGVYSNCLSYGNTGNGFSPRIAINCVAYGNTADGFLFSAANGICFNCISEANGGFGFNVGAITQSIIQNCATYNNTSGSVNSSVTFWNIGTITVTAGSVFTNAAGNDFSLNNTTNQGALLRAAGYPATFPRGTTPTFRDIGAAQHADPASAVVVEVNNTVILNRGGVAGY